MTKEDLENFAEAAKPLMTYLKDNHHPHTKVIIDSDTAEIMEGLATVVRMQEEEVNE